MCTRVPSARRSLSSAARVWTSVFFSGFSAEGDAAFHSALGAYTQNAALRSLMQGLIDASRKSAYAVYSLPETAAASLEQHGRIVEALAASDVDGAARLAQEHMLDVARRYSAAPQGPEGRP